MMDIAAVRDSLDGHDALSQALHDAHFDPRLVYSGIGAHQVVREMNPSVIILDIPADVADWKRRVLDDVVESGIEGRKLLIAVVADSATDTDHAAYLRSRGCRVVSKPADVPEVLSGVREANGT